jgi:hypothetical protein
MGDFACVAIFWQISLGVSAMKYFNVQTVHLTVSFPARLELHTENGHAGYLALFRNTFYLVKLRIY